MSSTQIWFGIPGTKMQLCPAPLINSQVSNVGYVETIVFENGGADVTRSAQYRKQYQFQISGLFDEVDGIGVYNKYASGFYGDGLIYFADPYTFETNMFSAGWASPGLIEQGWENIYDTVPTFANTTANIYNQPPRTATWAVTSSANAVPTTNNGTQYIVIPPTYTLNIGVTGSATGTAVVRVVPINTDGTNATAVDLTLIGATSATRMNATFAGSSYQAVKVYITRTSTSSSTISITSMMARMVETGASLTLTGDHMPGDGHTGLSFADDARVENYVYINPPRKAMNTTLLEVGAWR
jgi:hypothetical protein